MSSNSHPKTTTGALFEFGGFDMQWNYYDTAGRQAASCRSCGVQSKEWQRPRKARSKKIPYDFNDTNDDKVIISSRARRYLETCWPDQMEMRQIFDNAWEAEPKRVLIVKNPDDVTLYSSEFEGDDGNCCPDCGLYFCQTFNGYDYRFENPEIITENAILRTDITFGGSFRSPLWLAGPKAAFAISAKFREIWLRPFEKRKDGAWRYRIDAPFRADPKPDAVEPAYPDYLE